MPMERSGCSRCQAAFQCHALGPTKIQLDPYLHRNPSEVVAGVQQGCWWCLKIMHSFHVASGDKVLALDSFPASYPDFQTTVSRDGQLFHVQCFSAYMDLGRREPDNTYPYDDVGCLFEYADIHETDLLDRPSLGMSTNSQESFAFVAEQIGICQQSHSSCRSGSGTWYPTRLLQATTVNGRMQLKIVETAEKTLSAPYITLSHCWGGHVPLQLTTRSRDEFKKSIAEESMPVLYMDAVHIAQSLNITYIWIDSLCIMQDSREDWRRESSMMGLVYQNGLFNIEAVSAPNCSHSLFTARDPLQLFPHVVKASTSDDPRYVQWTENDDEYWATGGFMASEVLYSRGWVVQERLLALRSIMFTKKQIFYRCAEQLTSEIGGLRHFPLENRRGYSLYKNLSTAGLTEENCFELWRRVVRAYCICALTAPGDKLVAIAGVARMFGKVRKSRYLAGLWEHTILEDLLWIRAGDREPRPRDFRAPTWSWASVNITEHGEERTLRRKECTECLVSVPKLVEASMQLAGPDEYGEVQSGRLMMKGHLYPVFRNQKNILNPPNTKSATDLRAFITDAINNLFAEFQGQAVKTLVCPDYDDQDIRITLAECFMMPLLHEREYGTFHKIEGLLLAANTPEWGVYQRIGVFKIEGDLIRPTPEQRIGGKKKEPKLYKVGARLKQLHDDEICRPDEGMVLAFMTVMGDRGLEVPSHERDEHGRHTITLI
ncbi:heterokaryon incompatibility protein-domain-containing protein [Xylaria telfairii]|nr:heterokaryon incompatibility protein-domain-containing protein [Xylaria telfairii]